MGTDSALMVKTEQDVDSIADRLTKKFNDLWRELEPLQKEWVGAAGGSFQDVQARYNNDVAKLNMILRQIAEAVGSSGRDYSVSDDELKSEMQKAGANAGQITAALNLNP